jgi:hypothetical protein
MGDVSMKKIFTSVTLFVVLLFGMSACSDSSKDVSSNKNQSDSTSVESSNSPEC